MESDSQGDILMRRKVQNAILLQRQRDEANRVAEATKHVDTHKQQSTPVRGSPAGNSSYAISPVNGGASIDFSYPYSHSQQHLGSGPSRHVYNDSPPNVSSYRQSQSVGHRHRHGASKFTDDHIDSPPPFYHPSQMQHADPTSSATKSVAPNSSPSRRVFPLPADDDRAAHQHQFQTSPMRDTAVSGKNNVAQSKRQHTSAADIAVVREALQAQIDALSATILEKDRRADEQELRIESLERELEHQQKTHRDEIRLAVTGLLEESSVRVRQEGFIGLDRLRQEVANSDTPLDLIGKTSESGDHEARHDHKIAELRSAETEEERLHRALVQSVRQRYLARLQQY